MKHGYTKIHRPKNPDIKVGDLVQLIDGSSLIGANPQDDTYYLIGKEYPYITGYKLPLMNIFFEVVETDVEDVGSSFATIYNHVYVCDIKIKANDAYFYTSSNHVKKAKPSHEVLAEIRPVSFGEFFLNLTKGMDYYHGKAKTIR